MNDFVLATAPPQPNVYGPITPSQMFERASRLLRENFKLFFGIVLILIGVEVVFGGILGGSGFWISRSMAGAAPLARILVLAPAMLVGAVLLFILIQIIQGALFIATQAKLVNAPITVGESCNLAAEKVGRLIGISLLVALRTIGYLLLFYIAFGALAMIVALMFGGFSHAAGAMPFRFGHMPSLGMALFIVLLLLMAFLLYLVTLLWLITRYALSIPVALAEGLSVTESIRRSIHLSGGSRGRLYALFLAIFGVYLVFAAVTVPMQLIVVHGANLHAGSVIGALGLLLAAFRILVSAIIVAFIGIATALCYFDLRVRKEGFGTIAIPQQPAPPQASWPAPTDMPTGDVPLA
ncbi:MAG TPA: hypothetical protein VND66_04450 [Acidobacteriaceae bacterium]|nr:hypothetical protein [Acidobacteriaceae bacterium]